MAVKRLAFNKIQDSSMYFSEYQYDYVSLMLCGSGLHRFFIFPKTTRKIDLCISEKYIRGALRVNNVPPTYALSILLGKHEISDTVALDYYLKEWANDNLQFPVWVWIEYDVS